MFQDSVDLLLHLLFLCEFDLCDLCRRVNANPGAEDLTDAETQTITISITQEQEAPNLDPLAFFHKLATSPDSDLVFLP